MDVEQLHIVLQQSFSADAHVRKPAEETIRNLKNLPGSVQLLLQVAAEKQVRLDALPLGKMFERHESI
jgi:importin-7